jgi:uncharacterized RDD family membrane protein YckC
MIERPTGSASGPGDLADRGARLGATVLDLVLTMTIVYLPIVLAVFLRTMGRNRATTAIALLVGSSGLFIWGGFTYVGVKRSGQSPGKRLLGIRVVRRDGSPASAARIFWLRNLLNCLPAIVPPVGVVYGVVDSAFIFSQSRRCLHDRLADTIVVKA